MRYERRSYQRIRNDLKVSSRSSKRIWAAFLRDGEVLAGRMPTGRVRSMTPGDDAALAAMLVTDASLYLDELADGLSERLGERISIWQISTSLKVCKPSIARGDNCGMCPHLLSFASSRTRRTRAIGHIFTNRSAHPQSQTTISSHSFLLLLHLHSLLYSSASLFLSLARQRLNVTRKQLSKVALEQSARKVADYLLRIAGIPRDRLFFGDEVSNDDRSYYRTHGRSLRGVRARQYQLFARGVRYSTFGM